MGKSEQGAVWLDETKFSAYDYWQFWRNTSDADVALFLQLFTDLPLEQIKEVTSVSGQAINEAKILLADVQTAMCHGDAAAKQAKATAKETFLQAGLGEDLPVIKLDFAKQNSYLLTNVLVDLGFVTSNSQARRLIEQGAVKLETEAITSASYAIDSQHFGEKNQLKLACGKKKFASITKL